MPFAVKGLARFKLIKISGDSAESLSPVVLIDDFKENIIGLNIRGLNVDSIFFHLEFVPDKADTIQGFRVIEKTP